MARRGWVYWRANGQPWQVARPLRDLAGVLRGYGYTVGTLGDDAHLKHNPPEDHTPYSATGWPKAAAYGWVWAADVMAPRSGSGLPTLAQLGAQLYADRMAGDPAVAWIKYMNWTTAAGTCVHDSWTPKHVRRTSTDRGHIHLSACSDRAYYALAAGYDPVARLRGENTHVPIPKPAPAAPDITGRLLMKLPTLREGSSGVPVRRLQALINVAGGRVAVDGKFGPGTERELRAVQAHTKVTADGIAGPNTWAALLGVKL